MHSYRALPARRVIAIAPDFFIARERKLFDPPSIRFLFVSFVKPRKIIRRQRDINFAVGWKFRKSGGKSGARNMKYTRVRILQRIR